MLNDLVLAGKTALVTGAKRGLGKATAVALARAGADIIGVSATQEPTGSAVEKEVRDAGRSFAGRPCDFADRSQTYALLEWLHDEDHQIDILVNNAGDIRRADAVDYTDEDWDYLVEVNLTAPWVLSRELGRPMLARGEGKIVFIASLLSFQGGIRVPAYTASKSGIGGLIKALANEWAPLGVNVNAVAPGYMATDNTEPLRSDPVRAKALLERIPAQRWGSPEDIAGAVLYLCSPAADYVNGSILTVDGGWMGR